MNYRRCLLFTHSAADLHLFGLFIQRCDEEQEIPFCLLAFFLTLVRQICDVAKS